MVTVNIMLKVILKTVIQRFGKFLSFQSLSSPKNLQIILFQLFEQIKDPVMKEFWENYWDSDHSILSRQLYGPKSLTPLPHSL